MAPPTAILAYATDLTASLPYVPLGLFTLVGILAQVYRYQKVSSSSERQQTKWVVVGIVGFIFVEAISLILFFLIPATRQPGALRLFFVLVFGPLLLAGATLIPVTLTFAVLRYRLWDINFIVRRTLAYTLLTAVLVLAYSVSVTAFQALFISISGQESPIAIVISTLIIAALFSPLRGRLQGIIDRHFFRSKYDADQALAHFASSVRNEVDVRMLTADLVHVLRETLQPETVSVWIKPK